ncbi:MAG TPA: VWA domain-containing protein, partial [Thermoanaerobaculia bacterium]|nr:VWA domain-containing protein [Thermoanaerobaculia bacterium]
MATAFVLLGAGAVLLGLGPLLAQSPAQIPRVTGSVELSLVNVDVVVTGKDGRPVSGLTPADFTVFHGKKLVEITNFREEKPAPATSESGPASELAREATAAASMPTSGPTAVPPEPRTRRHVVMFIDHLALPDKREREEVFGSLKRLLRGALQPGDAAMIAWWRGGLQVVFPFTGDVGLLERQLDAVAKGSIRLGHEVEEELDKLAGDDWAYASAGVGDSSLSRNLNVQQAYSEVKGKVSALKGLIATMSGMEGRKALVFVSRNLSRSPGAEFFGTEMDARRLIDSVADKANAAGVTIHSLYASAWEAEQPNVSESGLNNPRLTGPLGLTRSTSKRVNEMASLATLTGRTGGVVITNTMEAPVFSGLVASDLQHWYSIGYPVPEGVGVSSEISVRVNRPGVTVRTRRNVVERTPEERIEDRVLANLFRMDESARLPIAVSNGTPKKEKKGRFLTPTLVRVPIRHLVLLPTATGMKGAVSIFTVSAGPGGEFSEIRRE